MKINFRLGFSSKISLLVAVPLVVSLVLGGYIISAKLSEHREAGVISEQLEVIKIISALEGARQKELLSSISFLTNPSAEYETLEKRRAKVDQLQNRLKNNFHLLNSKAAEISKLLKASKAKFKETRELIDTDSDFDPALLVNAYLETEGLLDLIYEIALKEAIKNATVYAYLDSIYDLETAKRFATLLNASLAARIGAGQPLSLDQVDRLNFFNGMLQVKLRKQSMQLTAEGKEGLVNLIDSNAYNSLPRAYYDVVGNYSTGTYFTDIVLLQTSANEFFRSISSIINKEHTHLHAKVNHEQLAAQTSFQSQTLFLAIISLVVVAFCYVTIRKISKSISSSVEELLSSTQYVNSAAKQLSASSQTMSSDALTSAASIEETIAHIEELTSMVNNNSEKAQEANKIAHESSETALKGEEEIQALLNSMNEIIESSKQVEEITRVIDEIAFQTNLLSLNAAVEAARAGEHGKGFSVVADAVRSLAQRSAVAAKDIDALVKDTVRKTEQGSRVASNGELVLKEIVQRSSGVADLVSEIAKANLQQSARIKAVSHATTQLDEVTQANAAASQETAAASEQLLSQSRFLNNVVKDLARLIDTRVVNKFLINRRAAKASPAVNPAVSNDISFWKREADAIEDGCDTGTYEIPQDLV